MTLNKKANFNIQHGYWIQIKLLQFGKRKFAAEKTPYFYHCLHSDLVDKIPIVCARWKKRFSVNKIIFQFHCFEWSIRIYNLAKLTENFWKTRMHSSRMRTGRTLTIFRSLLVVREGVWTGGGCTCLVWGVYLPGPGGGVPAWSGGCTCLGGGLPAWPGGCTCLVRKGGYTCLVRGVGGGCAWSGTTPL